jgi:hypothetical protein
MYPIVANEMEIRFAYCMSKTSFMARDIPA